MYELGLGLVRNTRRKKPGRIFSRISAALLPAVGTVCIALVLEALIMIIKYSQLDLASNLYYPVAILLACAFYCWRWGISGADTPGL